MARRNVRMEEYLEMVYQWHRGRSSRQIRDSLKMSRKTMGKYLGQLVAKGLSRDKPLPPDEELARMVASVVKVAVFEQPARERIRLYHEQIEEWLEQSDMTIQQVQRLLKEQHEVKVSYMSVYRYVRSHIVPLCKPVTVRMHSPAGSQGQVDFGYAGLMKDPETGKRRKTWVFIMILSYSRHRFVRFVFRQNSPTWLDCHMRAFSFFRGCPRLLVLDNLKDGVLKPDLYDPTLNPAYAELERHYGFVADPAKVQMARHKGKVERCVPVVRQQILAGRHFRDIDEANEKALEWCLKEVGLREHGTTHRKPYEVFSSEEADQLLVLPDQPYEAPQWKQCTVHWDCHLILDKCYYSVPYPYRGERLWVRSRSEAGASVSQPSVDQDPPAGLRAGLLADPDGRLSSRQADLSGADPRVVPAPVRRAGARSGPLRAARPWRSRHAQPEKSPGRAAAGRIGWPNPTRRPLWIRPAGGPCALTMSALLL